MVHTLCLYCIYAFNISSILFDWLISLLEGCGCYVNDSGNMSLLNHNFPVVN